MELSDKKLNAFQKGILQKYFSLALTACASLLWHMLSTD